MTCQACNQNALALHTALIEREHDAMVIADLKAKLAESERKVKDGEKGSRKTQK